MPGLDLAVAARQLYADGKHGTAVKTLRDELDLPLSAAIEWYTALTGWQPARMRRDSIEAIAQRMARPEPAAVAKDELAAAFDRVGDDIALPHGAGGPQCPVRHVRPPSLSASGPFAVGTDAVLGRDAFMARFNDLLRRIEKAAPHKAARELEHRIAEGERKIAAAAGKVPAEKIQAATMQLNHLKAELVKLHREYIVPHNVLHMLHYLLDLNGRQKWPHTDTGVLTVKLPGIIEVSVEVPTEPPF